MKRTALKRRPAARRPVDRPTEIAEARTWRTEVIRTGCVMCRLFPVPAALRRGRAPEFRFLQAHHIVGKRHLKREGLAHLLWAEDNGLCLCEYHHGRHERAVQRVPRAALPAAAVSFAEELGFGWVIDREYSW